MGDIPTGTSNNQTASGTHLIPVSVSSEGKATYEIDLAAHTGFDVRDDANDGITLNANLQVLTQEDNRSVSISSSIDPSYHRTMDGTQSISKYRNGALPVPFFAPMINEIGAGLLNEHGNGGAMTGDTVAFWQNGSWQAQAGFFHNDITGWNNPSYAWSVSGESTPASGYSTPENQPNSGLALGLNLGSSTEGFPKSSTVTLKVTDGQDGAVGTNTYDVKWHLPYEKTKDLPDGQQRKQVLWVSPDPITPPGGSVSATIIPAKPFNAAAAIDDVTVVAEEFGIPTEPVSELVKIFQAITNITQWGDSGQKIHVTANQISHTSEAFQGALDLHPDNIQGMTTAVRDALRAAADYSSWDDYECYGGYVRLHHEKSYLAEKYDASGFHSSNHLFKYDVKEREEFETFYQDKTTTPVPPTLGDREVPASYNLS